MNEFGHILCTTEAPDGLCLWWGSNRSGYTTNLDAAGLYRKEDAQEATSRDVWISESDVAEHAVRQRVAPRWAFDKHLAAQGQRSDAEI